MIFDWEKREKIYEICELYPVYKDGCPDCPLNSDPDAWCKKGFLRDIPAEDLDTIIEKMTTSKEMQ